MIELIVEFLAGLTAESLRKEEAMGYKAVFAIFFLLFLLFAIIHDFKLGTVSLSSLFSAVPAASLVALLCAALVYFSRKARTTQKRNWAQPD